jgi:colanic acid biosynthesis glycosyl transferase WcaI
MKIIIYSINYAPEVTGIGKYNGEMGEWLAERGHEVRVVTAPPYYPQWRTMKGYSSYRFRRESIAGADVWRCPTWIPAKPSGTKRLLHLASFAASSFPVMLRQIPWRPDVVMVTEPPLFCVPQARLTAHLSGAKAWLHVLDFEVDAALQLGMLDRWRCVQRPLYKVEHLAMRGIDRVSTISERMRQRVLGKGIPEDRVYLFPNWADTDLVLPLQRDNEVRREFGAGPDDTLVLYAGNIGAKQGLDLVLDAASRLRKRADIKFAMVGAGAARDGLEQTVRRRGLDNVRFFPVQPLERLPLMLTAGDIHLVVQRREAADLVMPSKLTNILAAGRPSIATVDPGTAVYQVLKEHDCGLTTTPDSVTELVAGIVALSEDAETRERLGRNARRYAESYLRRDKILFEFESTLQDLVGLKSRQS